MFLSRSRCIPLRALHSVPLHPWISAAPAKAYPGAVTPVLYYTTAFRKRQAFSDGTNCGVSCVFMAWIFHRRVNAVRPLGCLFFLEKGRVDVACYPWLSLPSLFPLGDGLGIDLYGFHAAKSCKSDFSHYNQKRNNRPRTAKLGQLFLK